MDRWKSPIDLQMFEESFATKILEDQTGCVVETCVKMVVNVDKEELLKALNYDRHQYEKGYADGRSARDSEIVRCKDCIHGIPTRIDTVTGEFSDERYCNRHCRCHFEDYYCADGKRKEGGAE